MIPADQAALQRGILLYQQDRPAEAEREFRRALSADVDSAEAHAWLAVALLEQEKLADAEAEARLAIVHDPELPWAHAALASVLRGRNQLKPAVASIDQAIELTGGGVAHYHGTRANLLLMQDRYRDALAAADAGLAVDAEDELCLNMRALAQTHLGMKQEAVETIRGALENNPEDAFTHANHGWAMLHQNRPREALDHFAQAMRLDPTNDFARSGLVEALKAKNPIYRAMLAYFLWIGRQARAVQVVVFVSVFFGPRLLRSIGRDNPELKPYAYTAAGLLYAFILMTWLAVPIFNSLLRLHPQGKYALSADQRRDSTLFIMFSAMLLAIASIAVVTRDVIWFAVAAAGGLILLPMSSIYRCSRGWPRNVMIGVTLMLIALATATVAVYLTRADDEAVLVTLIIAFCLLAFTSQFVAISMQKQMPKR